MREGGKKLRRLGLAAVFCSRRHYAGASQGNPACGAPAALDDGWTIASPESVGLDGARLCRIAARLKEIEANVHAVVIVRHGKLVFEQYFPGPDEPWGLDDGQHDFDATTKHDMRSASKSVISLLVGIAIDRKLIKSADEPVVKFFPDYSAQKSPGWDKITLRHLLTMSSGMQWDENRGWKDPKNDEPHLGNEADPIRYVLSKPIAEPPDTVWTYNGGGTDLLGNILERVSGKPLEAFAREVLFAPLGITDWEWMNYPERQDCLRRRSSPSPARCRKDRPARAQQGRMGTASRSSRPKWIEQSVTPRFQAIGYFGGLFFYGQQWWMGRSIVRRQGSEVDRREGLGRPAHLHRARPRPCGDDDIRALFQRASGRGGARHDGELHPSLHSRQQRA